MNSGQKGDFLKRTPIQNFHSGFLVFSYHVSIIQKQNLECILPIHLFTFSNGVSGSLGVTSLTVHRLNSFKFHFPAIPILFLFSKIVHIALLRITFMCLVTQFCVFCLFAFLSECCRSFSLYIACFGPHNGAKSTLGMHSAKK